MTTHDRSPAPSASAGRPPSDPPRRVPAHELWLYRDRTVALLHRYFRLSLELGRLPSLLGREFFRTRVTSYHLFTFEDGVIFVHDMERSLERLRPFSREIIARVVFQDYSREETARLLRCTERWVRQRLSEALDELTAVFLHNGLLHPLVQPPQRPAAPPPEPDHSRQTMVEISSSAEDSVSPAAGVPVPITVFAAVALPPAPLVPAPA